MKLKIFAVFLAGIILAGCSQNTQAVENTEINTKTNIIYGSVEADNKQGIVIDFPAIVKEVNVIEGEKLNQGDTILTLDISDYEFSIQQKKYQLEQYKISLGKAEKQQVSDKERIDYIDSQIELNKSYLENENSPELLTINNKIASLKKRLEIDNKNYESGKELYELGAISKAEYDDLEYALQNTQSEYDNAFLSLENTLTTLKLQVQSLESERNVLLSEIDNTGNSLASEIESLQVNIQSTQSEIENMENKLNKDYIKDGNIIAVKDGTVVYEINCQKGTVISDEIGYAVSLLYSDSLYVNGEVLEDMLSEISVGDTVDIKLAEDGADKIIKGDVVKLSDVAVEKDGDTVVNAKIEVDEGAEYLKSGLSVDIYLNNN